MLDGSQLLYICVFIIATHLGGMCKNLETERKPEVPEFGRHLSSSYAALKTSHYIILF